MRNLRTTVDQPTADATGSSLIHGRHVTLRPALAGFSTEELMRRFAWSKDANLQYWSGSIPSAKTFTEFCRVIGERDWPRDGSRQSFAIVDPVHGLVGMVSCYAIDWRNHTGELGVYIGESRLWGHGIGTDAVRALVHHAFGNLHLQCISLNTFANNHRALRSYSRVGFRRVATRRRFRPVIGYYKEVRMEISASDEGQDAAESQIAPSRRA